MHQLPLQVPARVLAEGNLKRKHKAHIMQNALA